jgi:hypothetical protein
LFGELLHHFEPPSISENYKIYISVFTFGLDEQGKVVTVAVQILMSGFFVAISAGPVVLICPQVMLTPALHAKVGKEARACPILGALHKKSSSSM